MNKKEQIIKELEELSKKCEEEKEKRENKLLFGRIVLKNFKKNIKYFILLGLGIFLIKNFNINETNYLQAKYFIDSCIITLICFLSDLSLSLYITSKDINILDNYKYLSKKISINLILLIIVFIIYYILKSGEII